MSKIDKIIGETPSKKKAMKRKTDTMKTKKDINAADPSLQHRFKRLEFDIDPYQGAAAMFGSCALKGYKIVSIERRGEKVVCEYEKVS